MQALEAARHAGMRAVSLHAPRAAVEQFTRAVKATRALGLPPDPEIHQERGRAYETLGEFESALADYTTALDLHDLQRISEPMENVFSSLVCFGPHATTSTPASSSPRLSLWRGSSATLQLSHAHSTALATGG